VRVLELALEYESTLSEPVESEVRRILARYEGEVEKLRRQACGDKQCPHCEGRGEIPTLTAGKYGCPKCGGTGWAD
jgi:DnaJ-class molecular chaperone